MESQGTEAELDVGEQRQGEKVSGGGGGEEGAGRRERAQTRGEVPGVLAEDAAQAGKGQGREGSVPVVLVSRKLTALSGMPHTLRTDTWQL